MMKEKKELSAQAAKEKALRLLEFRAHSEKELCDKLIRAGARHEDLPPITEFLKEYGFLNDGEYAKRLARDLQNMKKLGKRRIAAELKNRGIEGETAEIALLELADTEEDALLPLVQKKLGGNFERKNIDKTYRYFMYRGYEFGDIKRCIDALSAEEQTDGKDWD